MERESVTPPPVREPSRNAALRTVEQALLAAEFFAANAAYYTFVGTSQSLAFTTQLPESFPGVGELGSSLARRVHFGLVQGANGSARLILEHAPLLVDAAGGVAPFRVTLAEDVRALRIRFWSPEAGWVESWTLPNSLPALVQLTLNSRPSEGPGSRPQELVSRIVALPARSVPASFQIPPALEAQALGAETQVAAGGGRAATAATELLQSNRARRETGDSTLEVDLEWLGRSGVELARYILATESSSSAVPFDSLNQQWAGGPGDPDSPTARLPLDNFPLGRGTISVKIVDLDRMFNLNLADETILRQAMTLIGLSDTEAPVLIDSILDWQDRDDAPGANGAESDYYRRLDPPSLAKNGPFDQLSELLLVRGVTPAIYFGSPANGDGAAVAKGVGLVDLFTPLSGRLINVNTASAVVLQLLPQIDEAVAQAIVQARAGADGLDGTADDLPFRSPAELAGRVPGLGNPGTISEVLRFLTVRSLVFEARVTVDIEGSKRGYAALLGRIQGNDVSVLRMYRTD